MFGRPIPSSGQMLPVVGLGTWRGFDIGSGKTERRQRAEVLRALFANGGTVIDSSPMYGRAEAVTGDLLDELGAHDQAFVATKVWTQGRQAGIDEMRASLRLLKRERLELMQVHNLVDWRTHLPTLKAWRADGRFRYIGVTHYTASAHAELAKVLQAEAWDFVQLNYSLDDRDAERTLLPLAQERGIAVLVNRPFGGGGLMRSLRNKPLPGGRRRSTASPGRRCCSSSSSATLP
jgi:aryl-alcohol dehydrogenase-like predicted oxidoreductase